MTASEEREIIDRVLDGDKDAFELLVLENQKNVYNLALKMTGDEEDALDISQEAFLRAYIKLKGFRGDSRFSVWLYRLVYNLCVDFIRKRPRDQVVSLTYKDADGETYDLEIPDERDVPEEAILKHEKSKDIAEGIGELVPKHREILVMREITGMSYDEIAVVLSINEGTVKSRLARARKNLADILLKKGTFPECYRLIKAEGGGGSE